MQNNFKKNNFAVSEPFTPYLKLVYVSVRTCSEPLLVFMQTNLGKVCSEST